MNAASNIDVPEKEPTLIGKRLEVLALPPEKSSIKKAIVSADYIAADMDVPNLGLSDQAHWVRFTVDMNAAETTPVVYVPYNEIDVLNAYWVSSSDTLLLAHFGQAVPAVERIGPFDESAFRIPPNGKRSGQVYMELYSTKQIQVPVFLLSEEGLNSIRKERNLMSGGYMGIMLVLILYNVFIFLSIRDKSYLYYVLYMICIGFAQITLMGMDGILPWSDVQWIVTRTSVLCTLGSMLFASGFVRQFVGTATIIPRLDIGIKIFFGIISATLLLEILGFVLPAYQIAQALSGIYAFYLIGAGIVARRSGSRQAGFFLLAWSCFLVGAVCYILKDVGVLPYNQWTMYTMPIGSAIEGILLSFGLADRINVLRREKEASQAAALLASQENERIIREQNVMLEEKVQERTHALSETNEHLKRTQAQLVNSEKMASLGQLTAGIAHEINNPINFITSNIIPLRRNISEIVEVMQGYRKLEPENAKEQLTVLKAQEKKLGIAESIEELDDIIGSIAEGSSRTAEIVRGLRNFSRLDEDDLKESDLNEGVRSTLSLLSPQYRDKVTVDLELGDIPLVECYPGKVNQVFMNILTNGVQATLARTDGIQPRILITSEVVGDDVVVSIKDNGVGMTEEVKTHIFDPFFTTKAVGEGTGLGLAIVYGIIQDHHGRITTESAVGLGSDFKIILPIRRVRLNERRA